MALCNYTLSYWWQPISLKETPAHGEVGSTKYITRAQWIRRWPRGFAIMSFIRHQWRRRSRRSLGANPMAAKAPWTPLKWNPPAQAWFGVLHALIVPAVTNGLRRSHSQARPKLITWLAASAFLASRASAFLTREMAITHNALWNGGWGGGGGGDDGVQRFFLSYGGGGSHNFANVECQTLPVSCCRYPLRENQR